MFDVNSIMKLGKIIMVKENEKIFEEGTRASNYIYVVFSGRVGIFSKKIKKDNDLKIGEISAGSIFGEESAFSTNAHCYSAIALEKTALVLLTIDKFREACSTNPLFSISSIEGLTKRINKIYYKEVMPEKEIEKRESLKKEIAQEIKVNNVDNEIFPFGVKLYNITEPDTFKDFLYDYEVVCPLCKKKINVKTQLTARLSLVETDFFLHKHYKNFEPVWYNIWVCPHCYYSNLHYDFEEMSGTFNEDKLIKLLEKIKNQVKLTFSTPKNIDESIASYYLAIYCAEFYDAPYLKRAKLWLQLSWLYQEVKDETMYKNAAKKALDYYCKMYYDSNENLDPVHEQACLIVMAELFILFDDLERALVFLTNAKKLEGGNRYYMLKAERRADDVRDMRNELNKK